MRLRRLPSFALAAVALAGGLAPAAAETLYVEAATVLPIEGAAIPGGRIVVKDGVIAEVGKDVQRPPFSRLVDARTQTVTPGFVLPMTRIGMPDADAPSGPDAAAKVTMESGAKAVDELYPLEEDHALLLQLGITTMGLLPSDTQPGIPGQASAVLTRPGTAAERTLSAEAALVVQVATHGRWRQVVGEAFEKAQEQADDQRRKRPEKKDGAAKPPESGAKPARAGDPLRRAVEKEEPVILAPITPAGWVAAQDVLPLARMQVWVVDGLDLHPLAPGMKALGVRVITWPALVRLPRTRIAVNRAAEYEAAGVPFTFALPKDDVAGAVALRDAVIEMARTGCSRETALAAITKEAAAALGVGETVGTLQKGRRADLLFWSGDVLDPLSRLERVMVGGKFVRRLATERDLQAPDAESAAGGAP